MCQYFTLTDLFCAHFKSAQLIFIGYFFMVNIQNSFVDQADTKLKLLTKKRNLHEFTGTCRPRPTMYLHILFTVLNQYYCCNRAHHDINFDFRFFISLFWMGNVGTLVRLH